MDGHTPANGGNHVPIPVNGNGANGHHDDEHDGPQQSLFSGSEFIAEEPFKSKSRNNKPATISMFECALTLEQAREEKPVGMGR